MQLIFYHMLTVEKQNVEDTTVSTHTFLRESRQNHEVQALTWRVVLIHNEGDTASRQSMPNRND